MLLIPTTSHLKVINEELVAKITENANLRMKLGDIETTFEATVQVILSSDKAKSMETVLLSGIAREV